MFLKVHGKKLRGRKSISIKTPIEDVLSPNFVYFPLEINGIKYRRVVEIGSHVKKGQVLLQRDDRYAHPVCSSVSGTVTEIKKMWNCLGKQVEMLEVQNDFKEDQCYIPSSEFNLTKEEIVSKVRNAGIVGLGGAGFPTHVKLSPPPDKKITHVKRTREMLLDYINNSKSKYLLLVLSFNIFLCDLDNKLVFLLLNSIISSEDLYVLVSSIYLLPSNIFVKSSKLLYL